MTAIDLWWRTFADELSQWGLSSWVDRKFVAFAVVRADRALLLAGVGA